MAEKKVFMLRLDPDTWETLQRIASAEFRSVNGQIEFILNDWLRKTYGRSIKQIAESDDRQNGN